jgi:cytochrome c
MDWSILLTCVIVTATIAAQYPLRAQSLDGGSISSGRQIAATICGDCHASNGTIQAGPDFGDIANLPSTTELSLKAFLRSNHDNMPNFIISPAETEDVIAYILSLKRK